MSKYFVAVEPPGDQSLRIATVMRQLGDPSPVPHITVKAPSGLGPDLAWLPAVREVAARSERFIVTIREARTFSNRILYLAVQSANLAQLHQIILETVAPSPELVTKYSEERQYIPHLTLAISHIEYGLPPYQTLVSNLRGLDPFEAFELTIFRREDASTRYRTWQRLPLALSHKSSPNSNQRPSGRKHS